jgi:hypothetical protein
MEADMIRSIVLGACALFGVCLTGASSGEVTPTDIFGPSLVSPLGELPLRAAPPGYFTGMGDLIGSVDPDQEYIVLEMKSFHTIFGPQLWLRVQPAAPDAEGPAGWTYSGPDESLQNFMVHEPQPRMPRT